MRYLFIFLLSCSLHAIELSPSTDHASVYFISPNNGESISGKVTVRFGLENFGVAPAGTQVVHTGHHHLIIDADLPPLNLPIPADKNHVKSILFLLKLINRSFFPARRTNLSN